MQNPFADADEQDRDDQALVARAQGGDRAALEAVAGRHQAWLYNIAVRMLGHPQDAEDATQEILVKVAFVAISVDLTNAAPAATRGLVMGGYSTALYLGLGLGSLALGPVITREGYAIGFAVGGALGGLGTLLAAIRRGVPRLRATRSAAGRG